MPPVVGQRQPHECAAGQRVGVRRPFAGQVGEENEAIAAGGHPARRFHQLREWHAGRHRVAEPAEAACGRQHHGHHVPAPRHGMAEGVDAAARLEQGTLGRREHDAGRAERESDRALGHDTDAHRVGRLVAAAGDHRGSLLKTGRLGRPSMDRARDLRTLERRWQPGRIDPEGAHYLP